MDNDVDGLDKFMSKAIKVWIMIVLMLAGVLLIVLAGAACWGGAYLTGIWDG